DSYILGECKFKASPFSYTEYLNTKSKMLPQQEKADFHFYLFSESGFEEKLINEAEQNEKLVLFGIDDVVTGIH
ncbi:MAG: ATP-binding protein, partial [Clostridia bacterium]|nr:ATP-binding protein [Clostridia bacterium]